ncbi:Deoxyribonuclease II [Parelaphostrongylus tenuis]|uniref:Deoxyribonuclease II n=1 Tax=Parelaphostrongylus tenuis TaxID=148309 RepID=A0AAD5MD80_PARTN|nr:Deoxyribonuclease II [Parelaphostrongylus tenuis]
MEGEDVDWYAAIKLPSSVDDFEGHGFVYFDSSQTEWMLSSKPINSPSSAVGATVKQLYSKDKDLLKIAYNDDWPGTRKANSGRGHTKGEYDYPESGTKYAQSLLCISFDVDALPAISQYMRFAQVTPFITKLPQSIKAPYFEDVMNKKSLNPSETKFTYSENIHTSGGTNITIFSKHKKFNEDLWHDLIAPSLKTPLAVETWRNGAARDVGTQCGDGENVYDVTQVQLPSATFRNSLDHSKWGVSMDESMPFVCIGDVNRQVSVNASRSFHPALLYVPSKIK